MAKGQPVQPAAQNGAGKGKKPDFQFKGYIRCDLAKSEKEDYLQWKDLTGEDGLLTLLVKYADSGYRLSFGPKEDTFMASMSNVDADPATAGMVLTAFAGTSIDALYALAYKHSVKLAEDWGSGNDDEDWHIR